MAHRGRRGWSAAILGFAATTVLAVALLVYDRVSPVDAFLIGLVGSGIALVIEVLVRVEWVASDVAVLSAAGPYRDRLAAVAEASGAIARSAPHPVIAQELDRHYDAILRDLADLRRGRILARGTDYRFLLMAAARTETALVGVTNAIAGSPGDARWWTTEPGQRYWAENTAAIARGVRVQRIFVYAGLDDDLRRLLDHQADAGVDVRLVHRDAVDHELHANIAVFDGVLGWEGRTNAQGIQYENVLTHDRADVARLARQHALCEVASREYRPPT